MSRIIYKRSLAVWVGTVTLAKHQIQTITSVERNNQLIYRAASNLSSLSSSLSYKNLTCLLWTVVLWVNKLCVCMCLLVRGKLDRNRSEIRGSAVQGRLDQSRWPRKDPSKPVRFVARFLRAHLPESHSRGAPAPRPAPLFCQLTRQMTHALAG